MFLLWQTRRISSRCLSSQQVIEGSPEGILISAAIDTVRCIKALRGNVEPSTENLPSYGERSRLLCELPPHSEVRDQGIAVLVDEDVRRFDIPVHEPLSMNLKQPLGRMNQVGQRFVKGKRLLVVMFLDHILQAASPHPFEIQPRQAAPLPLPPQANDAGAVDCLQYFAFPVETPGLFRIDGQVREENFQRSAATRLLIECFDHPGHPTAPR